MVGLGIVLYHRVLGDGVNVGILCAVFITDSEGKYINQ